MELVLTDKGLEYLEQLEIKKVDRTVSRSEDQDYVLLHYLQTFPLDQENVEMTLGARGKGLVRDLFEAGHIDMVR